MLQNPNRRAGEGADGAPSTEHELPLLPIRRPPTSAAPRTARRSPSMSVTVSDQLLQRLQQWGVKRVYGYPGDGINGVMGALRRASDSIEFVQTRHEELAAFMATAHAKFTGEVGVCVAT